VSGYEVVIESLRKAGRAAGSAGEQAGAVDLAGAISGVRDSLPGSRSLHVAAEVATMWRAQIAGWSTEARKLGQDMTESADLYASNEQAAKDALTEAGRGSRWRVS
jgi:hypothetical protein